MTEDTRQMLVVFGLGIPIAAVLTYLHFKILRFIRERWGARD